MRLAAIILFSTFLTACAPMLYIPNELNMPMLDDSGSARATLHIGSGGIGGEGSYAFSDHFVALADGAYNGLSTIGTYKTFSYDAGGGYHVAWNDISLEILAGAGYGRADANVAYGVHIGEKENDILHGSYGRLFLQADLFRTNLKGTTIGYGIRLSYLEPTGFYYHQTLSVRGEKPLQPDTSKSGSQPTIYPWYVSYEGISNSLSPALLVEPAITFDKKLGKHLYFHSCFGISYCPTAVTPPAIENQVYWPITMTLGYSYVF